MPPFPLQTRKKTPRFLSPQIRRLTLPGLAAATYFMVSGGPYGLEDLISKAGYPRTLLILIILPLLWPLPTALMVGELASALPSEGGFYVWVKRALGNFWGFQEVWLTLAASVFDMAIYPTLFISYLARISPSLGSGRNALLIGLALIAACVIWNLFGAKSVGTGSVWLAFALLSPFAALILFALHQPHLNQQLSHQPSTDLMGGIMVAMWNFMGWDNASTVAGEVENPQRAYPRAMLYAAVAVVLSYIIPVSAMWIAHVPAAAFSTGGWADVGRTVGGPLLALSIIVAGMISSAGIFNSLSMSYSRLPLVVAEDGLLPPVLALTNRWGTPWVALLACAAAWALCLNLGFEHLIQLDVLLYGASLLLEFIALIVLRRREPHLPRPFRIPGPDWIAASLILGPLFLLIMALLRSESEHIAGFNALLFGAVLMAVGALLYPLLTLSKSRTPALGKSSKLKNINSL